METGIGDYVAIVAAVVAVCKTSQAENQEHQPVGTRFGVDLRRIWKHVPGRQENKSLGFATCRTGTSSVQIRCCQRLLAQRCLHGTLELASCIHVVV